MCLQLFAYTNIDVVNNKCCQMLVYVIKSYILLSFDCIIMEKDIQMGLRLKPEFHEECSKVAKEKGQSLAEWIRRAMQHELDRERDQSVKAGGVFVSYDELDAYIEKFFEKMMKERAKNDAESSRKSVKN